MHKFQAFYLGNYNNNQVIYISLLIVISSCTTVLKKSKRSNYTKYIDSLIKSFFKISRYDIRICLI